MLAAASAAGASSESVQHRVAADSPLLATPAERAAYIRGLHAAFLVLTNPSYTSKPPATPASPPTTRSPAPPQQPHSEMATVLHLGRQRAPLSTVAVDVSEATTSDAPSLPAPEVCAELLPEAARPLNLLSKFAPSRWLLLCAHDACHGTGCALQQRQKGLIAPALRERRTVDLFWRLIGVAPEERRDCSSELYSEAQFVHRRTRGTGPTIKGASQPLRRWLLEPPTACSRAAQAEPRSASPRSPSPRSPAGKGSSPGRGSPAAGGGSPRKSSPSPSANAGFLSSAPRPLQPTAGEEAAQRDLWMAKQV